MEVYASGTKREMKKVRDGLKENPYRMLRYDEKGEKAIRNIKVLKTRIFPAYRPNPYKVYALWIKIKEIK